MQKILSLTSKDFLRGISPYPYDSSYGLWRTASNFNPFSAIGTIQPSIGLTTIGGGTTADNITNFVTNSTDLYGLGSAGHLYKVATFTGTPTVTDVRSGTPITSPAIGLEVFQTKIGAANYLYYWQNGQIGQWDLAGAYATGWTDNKFSITSAYQTTVHPTLRIDDEIYYGAKYVISKLADDYTNADPAHTENVLDLPVDQVIVSLETDGTYLIILAQNLSSNTSKIYFWDYKNRLDTWTVSYKIEDIVTSLKNVNGSIYASGMSGLYVLNASTEPVRVRSDIKAASSSAYKILNKYNNGLFIGASGGLKTYGQILPSIPNTSFTISDASINAMAFPSGASANSRIFFSTGSTTLQYFNVLTKSTASSYQDMNLITSMIDLGDEFTVERIDIIFSEKLETGQGIDVITAYGGFSGDPTAIDNTAVSFNAITFATYGAKRRCKTFPTATNGELLTDTLLLRLAESGSTLGVNSIKRIDIYGERINS